MLNDLHANSCFLVPNDHVLRSTMAVATREVDKISACADRISEVTLSSIEVLFKMGGKAKPTKQLLSQPLGQ
jgi:hypothetical protein